MPNEREQQTHEKSGAQAGAEGGTLPDDQGEREPQAGEPEGQEGRERPIRRERREMEAADPRVGRGGDPVSAGREEDAEDTGDGSGRA